MVAATSLWSRDILTSSRAFNIHASRASLYGHRKHFLLVMVISQAKTVQFKLRSRRVEAPGADVSTCQHTKHSSRDRSTTDLQGTQAHGG
jgi:hypothetical protein